MTSPESRLEEHYRSILKDRMQDMPFVNSALDVQAVGFRDFDAHSLGVLISPWFVNLVLLPGTDDWSALEQGSVIGMALPGENIDFNVCHDEELGTYLTAVLFRTVADFPDQATATRVAEEVLDRLFTQKEKTATMGSPRMSRRELFTRLGAE
jgi:[NiFe] hydrogenase assembly HybE family chaperone